MKPFLKDVIFDDDGSNMVPLEFAVTIDFTALFDHIKDFAGIACEFHRPEITTSPGNVHISFMSTDITAQAGPFAAILKHCCISSFNNGVFKDKETGEFGYWVGVSLRYEHKNGGSNGMEMLRAWYKNGAWAFLNAGEGR
jgi:hypothetical protein